MSNNLECVVGEPREATNQPVYSVFILKYNSITRTPNFFESTDTVQDGAALLQPQNKMSLR